MWPKTPNNGPEVQRGDDARRPPSITPAVAANNLAANVTLVLRLHVAGNAPNSRVAIANLQAICEKNFSFGHWIEIVDLLRDPRQAIGDAILATPTLLKLSPPPTQRIAGNLSDTTQVLRTLVHR